jgi:hypothetical protein
MPLRLTEFEIEDIARLLADIPTKTEYTNKDVSCECIDCGKKDYVEVEETHERIDTMNREFIRTVVERIGEIYDVARARALRDAA